VVGSGVSWSAYTHTKLAKKKNCLSLLEKGGGESLAVVALGIQVLQKGGGVCVWGGVSAMVTGR
jgi:hypothetical protein